MTCPHCESAATTECPHRTELGYRRFCCRTCQRRFHERTGTAYNHLQYPTDIVSLVVLWRVRYKLSLRDLAEMFLQRGIVFTHETVRNWEAQLAPVLTELLRRKRRGAVRASWYVDETYVRVQGRWQDLWFCQLSRQHGQNRVFLHLQPPVFTRATVSHSALKIQFGAKADRTGQSGSTRRAECTSRCAFVRRTVERVACGRSAPRRRRPLGA
jgi:hypothetical protein